MRRALVVLVAAALPFTPIVAACKKEAASSDIGGRSGRGTRGEGGVSFAVDALEVKSQ